jgi:formylglycine-generating enzyme required for sulfatase activity
MNMIYKKIALLLFFIFSVSAIYSQKDTEDYIEYLEAAKKHIKNGDIDMAKKVYNIYKELTGHKDDYMESRLSLSSSLSKINTYRSAESAGNSTTPDFYKMPIYTIDINGVTIKMILVEGGIFQMGSDQWKNDEKPTHEITLSNYYIGETEVTQELWQAVMGRNPSTFKGDNQRPVETISWNDCQIFIKKLNALTNQQFKLPTEAEWEFAARGGNKSKGYNLSGGNSLAEVSWNLLNSKGTTFPVKQKIPNELGLYDMTGNVAEWCADYYNSNFYAQSPSSDPECTTGDSGMVIRGGSWSNHSSDCRTTCRLSRYAGSSASNIGFRLVLRDKNER